MCNKSICSKCGLDVLESFIGVSVTEEHIKQLQTTIEAFWEIEVTIDYCQALLKFINEYTEGGINATSNTVRR